MTTLTVILPVHNESEIIEDAFSEIYKKIRAAIKSSEFILVENGSKDNTLDILKKICKKHKGVFVSTAPIGYGSAILKGIKMANSNNVCYMPSDGQIDLSVFPQLLKEFNSGKWDLVKVKRKGRENIGRTLVSLIFATTIFLLFKTPHIDINASPRIIEKKRFEKLKLKSKDSFLDTELLIKISRLNWRIKEIPMENLPRIGGKSTRSISTFIEFFGNIYKYKVRKI